MQIMNERMMGEEDSDLDVDIDEDEDSDVSDFGLCLLPLRFFAVFSPPCSWLRLYLLQGMDLDSGTHQRGSHSMPMVVIFRLTGEHTSLSHFFSLSCVNREFKPYDVW
jgi:hypothetical protein